MLVEFFSEFSGFPPISKINISKFQFDREFEGHGFASQFIYLFIYLFVCLFVYLFIYFKFQLTCSTLLFSQSLIPSEGVQCLLMTYAKVNQKLVNKVL